MVILNLLRQGFTSATSIIRTNTVGSAGNKRLFINKSKSLLISSKRLAGAYDGDGKTCGFVINKRNAEVLLLDGTSPQGFLLSNGAQLVGSLIIFPHSLMSWNVISAEEVTEDSLSLFKIMDPKIDILVFGYGSRTAYTREIRENFQKICKNLGIRFEALPTEQAMGVYNFLADERRLVAAALIPPSSLSPFRYDEDTGPDLLDDLEEEDMDLISDQKISTKLIK